MVSEVGENSSAAYPVLCRVGRMTPEFVRRKPVQLPFRAPFAAHDAYARAAGIVAFQRVRVYAVEKIVKLFDAQRPVRKVFGGCLLRVQPLLLALPHGHAHGAVIREVFGEGNVPLPRTAEEAELPRIPVRRGAPADGIFDFERRSRIDAGERFAADIRVAHGTVLVPHGSKAARGNGSVHKIYPFTRR